MHEHKEACQDAYIKGVLRLSVIPLILLSELPDFFFLLYRPSIISSHPRHLCINWRMTDPAHLKYQLLRTRSAVCRPWKTRKSKRRTGGKKGRIFVLLGLSLGNRSLSWLGHC